MEIVKGQADLLEVVLALHARGGLAHLLDGGQQQADKDGDDCYHHQQLDQRERLSRTCPESHRWSSQLSMREERYSLQLERRDVVVPALDRCRHAGLGRIGGAPPQAST